MCRFLQLPASQSIDCASAKIVETPRPPGISTARGTWESDTKLRITVEEWPFRAVRSVVESGPLGPRKVERIHRALAPESTNFATHARRNWSFWSSAVEAISARTRHAVFAAQATQAST